MDVSIIIVSWNTRDILQECLESVYRNTHGIGFEVIVVDNHSADGSAAMVKEQFPQAVLIENDDNLGFATANNQAMRIATGEWVLLLNSDTLILDNAIAKTLAFANTRPDAAVVGCKAWDEDGIHHYLHRVPSLFNVMLSVSGLARLFPAHRFFGRAMMKWWSYDQVREVDWIAGCFMLVRCAAINKVGMFDEHFFMYGEDADWCKRFHKAGWKVVFFPGADFVHLMHQSTTNPDRDLELERRKSILRYFSKHHAGATVFCVNALYFLGDIARAVMLCPAAGLEALSGRRTGAGARLLARARLFGFHARRLLGGGLHLGKRLFMAAASCCYFVLIVLPQSVPRRIREAAPEELLVLCYHGVNGDEREVFAHHMDMILAAGRPVALGGSPDYRDGLPGIAVTFDDAFANIIENALPELASRGIPAMIFAPSGCLGSTPNWELPAGSVHGQERIMTPEELRGVLSPLVTVGSHTVTHVSLSALRDESARSELVDSKTQLEKLLGRPVTMVAFPYGEYAERTLVLAESAGYTRVFTLEPRMTKLGGGEFVSGRFWGDLGYTRIEFWLLLRGAYGWWASWQHLRKWAKRASAWARGVDLESR